MSYNIRSFNANSEIFLSMFQNYNCFPDILCLTETWFNEFSSEEIPGFTSYHTIRENGRSGGVSIYIKDSFNSCLMPNYSFSNNDIEICCVQITSNNISIYIFAIYRPHSGTIQNFNEILSSILDNPCMRNKLCVILGDLNINLLNDDLHTNSFIYNMQSHHFFPLITKPTRFSPIPGINPSLIDHIWLNEFTNNYRCSIVMNDFTDHCPVLLQINLNGPSCLNDEKIKIKFRCNDSSNRDKFKAKLINFDWKIIKSDNVNTYLDNFTNTLSRLYCESFPLKTKFVSKKQFSKPWITPSIKKLISYKSQYFQLLKLKTKVENNIFKNKIKNIVNKSKIEYLNNYFISYRTNLRKTWDMIKTLTSQNLTNKSIKRIVWNNVEYLNDLDIANAFNNFFCSIAKDLDDNLPISNADPLHYLKRNYLTSFYLSPVSSSEYLSITQNLKIKKQDVNNISIPIFKTYAVTFIDVLRDIINLAFSSGIFPDSLKIAYTTPIFKKGDKSNITNYRPISILPFVSKIFEKCLHQRLLHFLSSNQILTINQYGFLRGKSTEDATLKLIENLHNSLNSKFSAINIFIDFQKAFDTLNHTILIKKLEAYGICHFPLKLIASYLQNRKQYVKINNTFSSVGDITFGVPQGSVLGPLLFLIYINDLTNLSDQYKSILFADDTTLSFGGKHPLELTQLCNAELSKFSEWAISNRLSISVEKTFFNIISNSHHDFSLIELILDNRQLTRKNPITYLGVVFDENLNFKDHINFACKKVSKSIGVLNKLKTFTPFSTMKSLYYSLIYPYLNYCNLTWGGTFSTHLNPLIILQKKAIRIINNTSYLHHSSILI